MDVKNIEIVTKELERTLGKEKVLTEDFILSSYTYDGTLFFYPFSRPALVVLPYSTEEVQKIIRIANEYKIPVVVSGGRTSSYGSLDTNGGIAIDMTNMREIIEIDEDNLTFTVQGGAYVHHLQKVLNKRGFCYFSHPDNNAPMIFASEVSKNTGGAARSMYGYAAHRVVGLEAVLGNGDILVTGSSRVIKNTPNFLQSGIPDLTHLFVAAEGALGVITEVTMKMFMLPVAEGGMDIKFEGTMDGFKRLIEWAHELLCKCNRNYSHIFLYLGN
jgi:glycolate oxidase